MATQRHALGLAILACLAVGLAGAVSASAQSFARFGGGASVLTPSTSSQEEHWNDLLSSAVHDAWDRARNSSCAQVARQLGASDRMGRGITAYDITCLLASRGELSIAASRGAIPSPLRLRYIVRGNALGFRTTTPTPLGRYADPAFSARYDLDVRLYLSLPTSPGPVRVDSVRGSPMNTELDSQNLVADLGFVANAVNRFLGGTDFVALAARAFDTLSLDLSDQIEASLAPLASALTALGFGTVEARLADPARLRPGELGGRSFPASTPPGLRLVMLHRPWGLGPTPPEARVLHLYAIADNGALAWYRRDPATGRWSGPRRVGSGWHRFRTVLHASGGTFYALAPDGTLNWYRHDGLTGGTNSWRGPIVVARGWNRYSHVFAGDDGVIYGIERDGTLVWRRHIDAATGGTRWSEPRTVGSGWNGFTHVFSGGGGVIYAVRPDGQLLMYRHIGHATGASAWSGPRTVASGWNGYTNVAAAGEGVFLARRDDGRLFWLNHRTTGPPPTNPQPRREPNVREGPGQVAGSAGTQVPSGGDGRGVGAGAGDVAGAVLRAGSWLRPVEIGSGWRGLNALLVVATDARGVDVRLPQ